MDHSKSFRLTHRSMVTLEQLIFLVHEHLDGCSSRLIDPIPNAILGCLCFNFERRWATCRKQLSRASGSRWGPTRRRRGSPAWAAPRILTSAQSLRPRADFFSLGDRRSRRSGLPSSQLGLVCEFSSRSGGRVGRVHTI